MTDPGIAFQTAAVTAIKAAGVTRVVIDAHDATDYPFVVVGVDTVIPMPTKTSEGAELTHTFVCWSDDPDEAKTTASTVLAALTNRSAPLTVTGYTLAGCDLDFRGSPIIDTPTMDARFYGVPVRVRYRLVQT